MDLQQTQLQQDFEFGTPDDSHGVARRDPNYALILFVILVAAFGLAMAVIFLSNGKLPIVE